MLKLILDMLTVLQKKDFRALLLIRDQICRKCSENPKNRETLVHTLKENLKAYPGKTLLELAFDTACDETAYLIFTLYQDFTPDWPAFSSIKNEPLIVALFNTPERRALFYRTVVNWKPRTVEKSVYERLLNISDSTPSLSEIQKGAFLEKLKKIPLASLIKGIANNIGCEAKAIAFKRNYLESPLLQHSWKKYYQELAKTISENPNFVHKGPDLTPQALINATIGLHYYKIFLDLLSYRRFFTSNEQFKPLLDLALEALKESSEYNSFFALQRICLHYMKLLTNDAVSNTKKTIDVFKVEGFADKMLVHKAPGYLSAAFLYFALAQYSENIIKDETKAESYYLLAYYHLQVAIHIKGAEEQLYNAFLGIDCFQLLPFNSMEEANTFLYSYLKDDPLMIDRVKSQALLTAHKISNESVSDELAETEEIKIDSDIDITEIDTSSPLEPIISRDRVGPKR